MASQTVLIGSYTQPVPHVPLANGPGILTISLLGTAIKSVHTTPPSISGANPSYLAQSGSSIYAANEISSGTISHLHLTDGCLKLITRHECGKDPCHVTVVNNGVVAACFGDGSVWSYINHDGGLKLADRWVCHSAQGIHQALPIGNGRIIACAPVEGVLYELYRSDDGRLREMRKITMDGYVRHGVVSGESVFVVLAKERMVAKLDIETLRVVSRVELGEGNGVLGAIRAVDDDLYVSERGEGNNRIWCTGASQWCFESGGAIPRDFAIRGGVLVAAHQDGRIGIGGMAGLRGEGVLSVAVADASGALVSVIFLD